MNLIQNFFDVEIRPQQHISATGTCYKKRLSIKQPFFAETNEAYILIPSVNNNLPALLRISAL